MAQLFDAIQQLIRERKYVVSVHAGERLKQRRFIERQVVVGTLHGTLMLECPNASPNPTVEVCVILRNGTQCKAVWSYNAQHDKAVLVTVHRI